jgi:protein-L-isoaspartate(D-aspartate) O-methyltransferase
VSSDSRKIRLIMELRRSGISDTRVCAAIERIPREQFVPEALRHQAYENIPLAIGCDQTMSAPIVVGRMTQALEPGERMKVLEVGTGSGYQAAVLSRLCRRVYTIERHRPLLEAAEAALKALHITNVTAKSGDGTLGWPEQAPFERIIVTAAAADIPPVLAEQLALDGIMVVPVDHGHGESRLLRVRRRADGLDSEDLGEIRFVPLIAARGGG